MAIDRLLQRLASLAALTGVAPAFIYLDLLAQGIIFCALTGGLLADRNRKQLLSPLPATLLSFAGFFLYFVQMSGNNIVDPLINMLVVLLAVRLLTEKSGRNLLQIFVLATFVLAASSLVSLSAFYLLCLVFLIILVTFGLLLTSFFVSDPHLRLKSVEKRALLKTGTLLPVGSLVLMLFFFLLLPRTEHPLWNFLNPKTNPMAGFSEEVSPGSISNLGQSGKTAFRVEMNQTDPQQLYWRGLVLNQTDGRSWSRNKYPPNDVVTRKASTDDKVTIISEPRSDRYLPGPDLPLGISGLRVQPFADNVFEAGRRLNKTSRYQVRFTPDARPNLQNARNTDFYLQTPQSFSARLAAVAERLARQPDRHTKIRAANDFFRAQQLSYAALDLPRTEDPVDLFLFETRRGYCEYFASSYALLLRLAGVPARLVGGYLGGRYNEMGGYYLVDEDMAHVWVEALDDQDRWQRIDPSRLAINAEHAVTGLLRNNLDWTQAAYDYLNVAWSRLVITYDLRTQFRLFFSATRNLRQFKPRLSGGVLWWALGALVLFGGTWLARTWSQRPTEAESLLRAYLKQIYRLSGRDQLPPRLGLQGLARLSKEPLCAEFARIYGACLYRDQNLATRDRYRLQQIVRQLKKRKDRITFESSRSAQGND